MSRSRGDDVIRGFYSQVLEDSLVVRVQGSVEQYGGPHAARLESKPGDDRDETDSSD